MLSIACCEDDSITLDILMVMLGNYAEKTHTTIRTQGFETGSMLLEAIDNCEPFDIFILDYYMPFMNGINVAKALRERGEKGVIIFSTSSMAGVIDAFSVNTFRYLLKPLDYNVLSDTLNAAKEAIEGGASVTHEVNTRDGIRKIKDNDVVYIEKFNRSLIYHLSDGDEVESTTLRGSVRDAVSPLLDTGKFIMAGPSLAINLCRIESMSLGEVFFTNGDVVSPPRREFTSVKNAWRKITSGS